MNLQRPEVARALGAAVAVLLMIGVVGAFAVSPDDQSLAATRGTKRSTSTLAGAATTTTEAAPAGLGTDPTATTTTSRAAAPSNVPDPGPAGLPALGTYIYARTNSADPSLDGDTERKVEELPVESGSPGRRQTAKDRQGNVQTDDLRWANDGIRLMSSRISSGEGTVECTWEPPLLTHLLPLAEGKSWKSDSTCTTSVAGSQVTIRRVADSKVVGKSLDEVDGEEVAAWVIDATSTITVRSAFYNEETKSKVTSHFAAGRGLVTIEKGTIESGPRKGTFEMRLKSLLPR